MKLKGKTTRVLAGACSAREAWQACPRWSGDLVVLRPWAVRRPGGPETMDGNAEHLQLPLQSLIEKAMQGGWVGFK